MIISPDDFKNIKTLLSNECSKRDISHSTSTPLTNYKSGTEYDFSMAPSSNNIVLKEHYKKIFLPLNVFNSNLFTYNANKIIVTEDEMLKAVTFLTTASERIKTDQQNTDCTDSSCTGYCYKTCYASCKDDNCSGSCGGSSCSGSCKGDCGNDCTGDCDDQCEGCGGQCSSGCGGYCTDTCDSVCSVTCTAYCEYNYCAPDACEGYAASL